jgi:hypothetical protein
MLELKDITGIMSDYADHSGRAVKGMNSLHPLKHWDLRIPLEAWMSVSVFSVFVLSSVQVAAL